MDEFLAQLQIVLPVLGVNVIRVRPVVVKAVGAPASAESPMFVLQELGSAVNARAQQIDGEFAVLEGSTAVAEWSRVGGAESTKKSYASPSTAGAIVVGRSCNGRKEWVSTKGQTFGVWEDRGALEV